MTIPTRHTPWSDEPPSVLERQLLEALSAYLSPITAKAALYFAASTLGVSVDRLGRAEPADLVAQLERAVRLYAPDVSRRDLSSLADVVGSRLKTRRHSGTCRVDVANAEMKAAAPAPAASADRAAPLLAPVTVSIVDEAGIMLARHAGREMCERMGFSRSQEIKTATLISELARNIVLYCKRGEITVREWREQRERGIEIVARDEGPGIPNLEAIMSGKYRSRTGLGLGLLGSKRLAHFFQVTTAATGTQVVARMALR